ncbi:ribbon-helix-helix domain-containing protein, partial [Acinetobacter baumannii]
MPTVKIAITMDQKLVAQIDRLVENHHFPNRSRAIQQLVEKKLHRLNKRRLSRECSLLEPSYEQKLAEEGVEGDSA